MNLGSAPKSGTMYALYKDRVEYRKYQLEDLRTEAQLEENLLELHLFDDVSEYRMVKADRGEIENCVNDANTHFDDKYVERIYVHPGYHMPEQVEVINYITYDENDLARINNYRLREAT